MSTYLNLTGAVGSYASAPDSVPLSVTEFDVMVYCSLTDWTPAAIQEFLSKNTATGNQRSYQFYVNTNGTFGIAGSLDGVNNAITSNSTVAPSFTNAKAYWVRGTRSTSSGDIKFYTSEDPLNTAYGSISWTQLGTTVSDDTGNFFNSTAILEIGSTGVGVGGPAAGKFYRAAVYNGYDGAGSLVFDANFSNQPGSLTSFNESVNAAPVTINGTADITSDTLPNNYRFASAGDGMSVTEKR